MRKLIFLVLMGCSCAASAQSADVGKLPEGAHIESIGAAEWVVMADGRRLPWNMAVGSDMTYNSEHPAQFPARAIRQQHDGVVVTLVLIGVKGEVKAVKVQRSSGFSELDDAAVDTVKGWKFSPAYASGVPTESYTQVPINFNMRPWWSPAAK